MKVFLLTPAEEHVGWDEHEAWVVLASTAADAWALVESGDYEVPMVRELRDGYWLRVQPERSVSISEGVTVEVLGDSPEREPRIAFAAFKRG